MRHLNTLQEQRVCITRPKDQAHPLVEAITQAGGHPIVFPTLQIIESAPLKTRQRLLEKGLADCDFVIFVSPNAVRYTFDAINPSDLPQATQLAVIGPGTGAKLLALGFKQVICPVNQFQTEGLLTCSEFKHIEDSRIVLIRGSVTRGKLSQTLQARGAKLTEITVYKQLIPDYPANMPEQLLGAGGPDITVVTSVRALCNLLELVSAELAQSLKRKPLLVSSQRIATQAKSLGFNSINLADNATVPALINALNKLGQDDGT